MLFFFFFEINLGEREREKTPPRGLEGRRHGGRAAHVSGLEED